MDIRKYLADSKTAVDECLERLLPATNQEPRTIHKAMRHSVFAGGKRIRPILVLAAGESLGGQRGCLLHLGAAIEMIHTYSLIHDDLPALDNDDLRRGIPTCHKVFGEAMAVLAGDALLTRGFQVLVDLPRISDEARIAVTREVAYAVGTVNGMIGGQVVDLECEGAPCTPSLLQYIHESKTGALLAACVRCGALASGATDDQFPALSAYGRNIGLAFQIMDDILDITASSAELGKTAGKDVNAQKATYPALYGIEASRAKALELTGSAIESVQRFGDRAEPLRAIAQFIVSRNA